MGEKSKMMFAPSAVQRHLVFWLHLQHTAEVCQGLLISSPVPQRRPSAAQEGRIGWLQSTRPAAGQAQLEVLLQPSPFCMMYALGIY